MLDAQNAPSLPVAIRREDYCPPEWLVPQTELEFELGADLTRVRARLLVERASAQSGDWIRLDGDEIEPDLVRVDGAEPEWRMEDGDLLVELSGQKHWLEVHTSIRPRENSRLMGLYESGGILCTQCEAQGFRRITFFPDRPDVLSEYRVKMIADRSLYPVLLSNGDPVANGDLEDSRHWASWKDPHPKPSYLFALVAGDLVANRDVFVTRSGRRVDLGIWVREPDLERTAHAMDSLKAAMAWDEEVYGREYDLDVFNIVAVADFNFGAMENKGLNIFNTRYILADSRTATDADYDAIASVVAHEYFHNWSGNRVTCRDWFQLSLKEGFTVFRDQGFSGDMGSAAVKRIEDVRALRAAQFPEDAGPLAHPVRPDSYIEISNFYTSTIYVKGAELIRMLHTLLGEEKFRAGCDLYFDRHDGEAVTCEDFVRAMEDSSGLDLSGFRLWYSQAGTPRVRARLDHGEGKTLLTLEQSVPPTPGQPDKAPMPIPLRLALFGSESGEKLEERLVLLEGERKVLTLDSGDQRPVLSINRGFSAPINLETDRSPEDLAFLSAHDDDPFARYEAMQQLMLDTLLAEIAGRTTDHGPVVKAVGRILSNNELDTAFIAETVMLPSENLIGDHLDLVDPDAIRKARDGLRNALGKELEAQWRGLYSRCAATSFSLTPEAKGARRLRSVALNYLLASRAENSASLAWRQYLDADNMTDQQGALAALVNSDAPEREMALAAYYDSWRHDPLVLDKWFTIQALSVSDDTVDRVNELTNHPDFNLTNPNRIRALIGAFAANQRAFHDPSGRGYRLVADMIIAIDRINPQVAARLVPPLGRWRRFDEGRAAMMRSELERIIASPGLSKDVFEQASKSLG